MADDTRDNRDLVLAPNQQATILDLTKGNVTVYVGPTKTSLAQTDRLVLYNPRTRRFDSTTNPDAAVLVWPLAEEGSYIVLQNPAAKKEDAHPQFGSSSTAVRLENGKRVNIHGPCTFPLWPGQVAEVIKGHTLRSNEYVLVEVYNDQAARENWMSSVIKKQTVLPKTGESSPSDDSTENKEADLLGDVPDLTVGQRIIIPGTSVSFYMPPTGISVVKDENIGEYVRQAVTLERLEYCILLNENGEKRYVYGPQVVFPEPDEQFIEQDGARKFRAFELNPLSGLYIKVIAEYDDEKSGQHYSVGDELFITGSDQAIYYPRPEHAIIKYDDKEVNHSVAIPEGEARYVLNRNTGEVNLVRGPKMFLPDPRTQVLVLRVLTDREVRLWFPGNQKALEYNQGLEQALSSDDQTGLNYVEERTLLPQSRQVRARGMSASFDASQRFMGDELQRKSTYTPPRTITLDTKYEGAVCIEIYPEYAVMIVNRSGERRVEVGPKTILLEYDETLMPMELSTGTPKSDDRKIQTVYLLTRNNRVSDLVSVETRDLVQMRLSLSYRVNFEGDDPLKWFSAENYVKLLTDHMRSLLRGVVKRYEIEDFYRDAIPVIRDAILGLSKESDKKRTGRYFEENGMRVYDVEVLDVQISDRNIAELLRMSQNEAVRQALEITQSERYLNNAIRREEFKRQQAESEARTAAITADLEIATAAKRAEVVIAQLEASAAAEILKLRAERDRQDTLKSIKDAELARMQAEADMNLKNQRKQQELRLAELSAQVQAAINKAQAVSPQLVSALQTFGDQLTLQKMVEALAPLVVLDRVSLQNVLEGIFEGTPFANALANMNSFTSMRELSSGSDLKTGKSPVNGK